MTREQSAAEQVSGGSDPELSTEQVADHLRRNPDFFIENEDVLAELSLPHESGKAISLLERQVSILRERGIEARQKLNNLLSNARNNDQLFDITRNLVLALLRADTATDIIQVTLDQLSNQENIHGCEIILINHPGLNVADYIRVEEHDTLKSEFADVFRLKRTHCGALTPTQVDHLFAAGAKNIRSTAICPALCNSEVLALLVLGNDSDDYFNVHLDTLFLDFIGHVIGAVLHRQLNAADS